MRAVVRRAMWVLLGALAPFTLAFGPGIVAAIGYLHDPADYGLHPDRAHEAIAMAVQVVAIIWAAAAARRLTSARVLKVAPGGWWREVDAAALFFALFMVSLMVGRLFGPGGDYPEGHGPGERWWDLSGALLAGPSEEIVVLVAPVLILRWAKVPWGWIVPLLVLARLSYHVYYGWAVIGLALWAAGTIAVYARTGAVIGPILMHSAWDTLSTVHTFWGGAAQVPLEALIVATVLLSAYRFAQRQMNNRRARLHPPITTPQI